MSHSPPNYVEGVPVKISEKYKPPAIISLPHSTLQRMKNDENAFNQLDYNFSLERNVLSKIEQWKKVRETERENRRERLRRNELQRAREIEENQKQLLTAVSYPSTEELSSDDDEPSTSAAAYIHNESGAPVPLHSGAHFSPSQQRFDTILTPTVVPETYCNKMKTNSMKLSSASKINYSDFENDTSSPFDNIELKTINDLDILAQVLNVTQIHSKKDSPQTDECSQNANNITSPNNVCEEQVNNENICLNGNGIVQQTIHHHTFHPTTSFLQDTSNLSYDQAASHNYSNLGGADKSDFYCYNNLPNNQIYNGYAYSNYPVSGSNLQNYHRTLLSQINYGNHSNLDVHSSYSEPTVVQPAMSKSKSVPDILKELNDEITDSEIRRSKISDQVLERSEDLSVDVPVTSKQEVQTPQSFLKLSPSLQRLVKNISLMGFPLERVSKIAEKLGNDDKKIFEHLIPLSELLDLGFEEAQISEALLRFDNNKDKALDFLIS